MDGTFSPGILRLHAATPNPQGAAQSQLFLLHGDATNEASLQVELAPGVKWPSKNRAAIPPFDLQIFHFNDLHGHLMRFLHGGEDAILSRVAWQIHTARQNCQGKPDAAVLAVTAGDDCGGSIFDEMLMGRDPVHPSYQLYSKMGVDVAGLGNHDLDRGLHALANAIRRDARFPVLAANLKACPELQGVCHPAAILAVKGVRVGLIGLVTRAETRLAPEICHIVDPIPVAQNLVPALRPWCDVLIIVSHLGYSLQHSRVPMADAGDVEVARSLPAGSVDLIIGGHSHTVLNRAGWQDENSINGIPIVQSGAQGEYLGQVDLRIQAGAARMQEARLIPVASLPMDQAFEDRVFNRNHIDNRLPLGGRILLRQGRVSHGPKEG